MAARAPCIRCARSLLRQQLPLSRQSQKLSPHIRPFTTAPRSLAVTPPSVAESDTHKAPIIPPLTDTSLRESRPPLPPSTAASSPSATSSLLRTLRTSSPQTYTAYGGTAAIYKECARQADYTMPSPDTPGTAHPPPKTPDGIDLGVGTTWYHTHLHLPPTFNTWSQITMLHLYLFTTRLRLLPAAQSPTWQQHLLDHFFYDAEQRMVLHHGMAARGVRNRYLKDLFVQYRGVLAAYDEGLCKGDAVLGTAVWRNVWGGAGLADGAVDAVGVAELVAYVRWVLHALEAQTDEDVMGGGVGFEVDGEGGALRREVSVRSKLVDEPFRKEDFGDET